MRTDEPDPITAVAALDEPTRRRLYDYVVGAREPVGRDEASEGVGISRPTAAFHLDRLVDHGLLDVVRKRLTGRTGPGAGRPSKLYVRADRQVEVSLPGRRYELAGELLAGAAEDADADGVPIRQALAVRAQRAGLHLGQAAGAVDAVSVLDSYGFEPRTEDGVVTLGNCPFHNLAQQHTELVCGMNLHLVEGLLEGVGCEAYAATLSPSPGNCCVVLAPS